jgi:signal transduction histidine kinase
VDQTSSLALAIVAGAVFAVVVGSVAIAALIMLRVQRARAAETARWIEAKLVAEDTVRQEVSFELHDDLLQRLYGASLELAALPDPPTAIQEEIRTITDDLRRLSHAMHPPALDIVGLSGGLPLLAAEWQKRSAARISLDINLDRGVPGEWVTPTYRWFQEALRNAVTHAEAKAIVVGLYEGAEALRLVVKDDGKGFTLDEAVASQRLGLRSLHGRLRPLGGRTEITSDAGATRVEGWIPWPT